VLGPAVLGLAVLNAAVLNAAVLGPAVLSPAMLGSGIPGAARLSTGREIAGRRCTCRRSTGGLGSTRPAAAGRHPAARRHRAAGRHPAGGRRRPAQFRRAGLRGHDELAPGKLLGEPDLPGVHVPGHGHDGAAQAGRAEPQQGGDRGMTGVSKGCEHVVSPIGTVCAGQPAPEPVRLRLATCTIACPVPRQYSNI